MLFYILTGITVLATVALYKLDAHIIIRETFSRKYKKWKKINSLVSTQYESNYDIIFISLKMITQAIYLSFIQYLSNTVRKIDKNMYEVEYLIGGKLYKMIVIPKKGPNPILQVRNEDDTDITDFIIPYYGPNYDWHNIQVFPQLFGCKEMTFELSDGSEKVFGKLDNIDITLV